MRADSLPDWSEIWGGYFFFFKIRVSAATTITVEREMIAIVDFNAQKLNLTCPLTNFIVAGFIFLFVVMHRHGFL